MIATVDISVQAANPSMPLLPMRAFEGSPSSIRVRNVPKRIGDWVINKVYFAVTYPDNTTQTIECKLVGGVYVGTVSGCATIGDVKNGYSIFADGKDENGNAVTDYCLGKGDVQVLDASGITQPLQNTTFVQILSAHPTSPNDGDMWQEDGAWYVWQNNQAWPIGGGSTDLDSKLDFDISDVPPWEPGDFSKGDYCIDEGVYYKYIYDGTQYDGDEPSINPNWEPCSFQMRLSAAQISAIDSVVDERATVLVLEGENERSFDWSGELTLSKLAEAGLYDTEGQIWTARLISAKIGTGITSIGDNVFAWCEFLTSVTIPDSVTSIGSWAFAGDIELTSVTIPDNVTSIGQGAFSNCISMANVRIGAGIISIDEYAFEDSRNLQSVVFNDKTIGFVGVMANYPWGISDTSIISVENNATKEWVANQNYSSRFGFVNAFISNAGGRKAKLTPYMVNITTLTAATTSFAITPQGTAGTVMREMYYVLTISEAQPVTWATTVDVFQGGSAEVVAPVVGTNIYHIIEYTSGHFAVSKEI